MKAPCPRNLKRAFNTKKVAQMAINRRRSKNPKCPVLEPYKCQCGMWHVTSNITR